MTRVSLEHKYLEKHFMFMRVNVKKLLECISKQLRYHQHGTRSETGVSLEIMLKCLTVSLFPLQFLLWQYTILLYFSWDPL